MLDSAGEHRDPERRAGEYAAVVEVMSAGFLERPDVPAVAASVDRWWEPARTWVAFDGERACGTFRSWATELTVPGGAAARVRRVRRDGPAHPPTAGDPARHGRPEHAALRARGEAVGLLYASEYPIYGRFGYGPATRAATWSLDTHATAFTGLRAGVELAPDEEHPGGAEGRLRGVAGPAGG